MRLDLIEVTAFDGTHEKKRAMKAGCDNGSCDNDSFVVYQVEGDNHFHLQCYICGTSYCPAGSCIGVPS